MFLMEEAAMGSDVSSSDTEGTYEYRQSFGSIMVTMYTLWKLISGGDDWGPYCDWLFTISPIMGAVCLSFIIFSVCAMFNVVTGIFVNKAVQAAESDMDLILIHNHQNRKNDIDDLEKVFAKADEDGDGNLNREEFRHHFGNPCVQAFLSGLGLDLEGVTPDHIFSLLDQDDDGYISAQEFVFGSTMMKGHARNLDLLRVSTEMRRHFHLLERLVENVEPPDSGAAEGSLVEAELQIRDRESDMPLSKQGNEDTNQ